MKIELKNFKCWSDNTFEIPDKGIVLLSAESGTGKSSLLDAISWVLFGSIKSTLSLGSTSGYVKLWYEDLYVYRSKRPNRLVIKYEDKEYEDDTAQYKLEEMFGSNFEIVSYIKQDNINSFCRISPSEKTEFIEQSIFHNTDIKHMKSRVKELIKEREIKFAELQSKLNALEKFHLEKPVITRFPIACDPSKQSEIIEKYQKLFDNSDSKLTEIKQQIAKQPSKTSKEIQAEINEKQKHLDYFTGQYNDKIEEINLVSFNEGEYDLLITMKENLDKYREKTYIEKELLSISQTIKDNDEQTVKDRLIITEKLDDISDGIEDEISTMDEYIQDCKQREKIKEQLDDLVDVTKEKINLLKKEQEEYDLKNGVEVNCPSCKTDLIFMNSKLFYTINKDSSTSCDRRKDIDRYEKKLVKKQLLEKQYNDISEQYDEWPDKNDVTQHIKELKEQLELKRELENRLKQLNNNSYNDKLLRKQKELQSAYDKYKTLIIPDDVKENDIIKKLSDIEVKKHNKQRLSGEIKTISDKNNKLINEIVNLRNTLSITVNSEMEIAHYEEKYKELSDKKVKYEKILSQIDKWSKGLSELKKWETYKQELSTTKADIESEKEKLESIYTIKTKITEAESICTSNFINVLNTHTQSYTDSFFKNNTILVNLQRQKISKKGNEKPQLNITVNYKGNETDMSILSGGEKDRIDLAFTLALSEIFKSKVLLLDECISSLDHSNSENVIEGLRDLYKGNLVIVVAHQVNEGLFDHIVKLN